MTFMSISSTRDASIHKEPCSRLHKPHYIGRVLPMSRVRRVAFLVVSIALVGASSTGLSRSACGKEIRDVAALWSGGDEALDNDGNCVDGKRICPGLN